MHARRAGPQPGSQAPGFIPEIESLRGVAITLVFLMHANLALPVLPGTWVSPLRAFVSAGHTGVSLFFIISGFLLSPPFLAEAAGGMRVRRSAYYARRALRILPLYYVAVVAAAVLCANRAADVLRGVPYLFFVNGLPAVVTPLLPYSNVWWSLATEVEFYLLLPALPLLLRSRKWRWWVAAAYIAVYVLIFGSAVIPRQVRGLDKLATSLFGRAPLFVLGILAAWLDSRYHKPVRRWASNRAWMRNGGADLVLWGALAALGVLLQRVLYVGYFNAELICQWWHVVEGVLWTAVLLLLLLAPLRTKWILSNPGWRLVGLLSYSIYIIHYPLIVWVLATLHHVALRTVVGWDVMRPQTLLWVAPVCVALSAVTYVLIERPFLRRKARVFRWAGELPAVPPIQRGPDWRATN